LTKRVRLDTELVRRGLASSRESARRAVEEGKVLVRGMPTPRPATLVDSDTTISLTGPARRFVSRGGEKLDGALTNLQIAVEGRTWLDAGASTGGFTDRLLAGGAAAVIAVDVGYGQLDQRLREDHRVVVVERTNVRTLDPSELPFAPDGVVADLSFISLRTVLPALRRVARDDADFVLLVKPQFEVGRRDVGTHGVVRDPDLWRRAINGVVDRGRELGLGLRAATVAEPSGPAGNREFFVHLHGAASASRDVIEAAIRDALQ
jgi:23S rRNA (cytidine1920-2'-O)/16S rRNA (cytidine1409-2'-O)-methyltransferase